jgi:chaperonin GroEL
MGKNISLGLDALINLKEGVNLLSNSVKSTLGPLGKTAILHRGLGGPHVTKDGVTVSKDIESNNKTAQLAIDVLKQASENTVDLAGDGTTSSITLASSKFY